MEYNNNFAKSFEYMIKFGKAVEPGQEVFVSVTKTNDIVLAIRKAYFDMSPRTIKGNSKEKQKEEIDPKGKEDLFFAMADYFSKYFEKDSIDTQEQFDDWHKSICKLFLEGDDKVRGYNKLLTDSKKGNVHFGKAQKIVNMTFKYLYCFDDAKVYAHKFDFCHIALDSFILDWVYDKCLKEKYNGIKFTKYGKNSLPNWSNLEYSANGHIPQYKEIQEIIRNKIKDIEEYKGLTPFLAEFKIWYKMRKKMTIEIIKENEFEETHNMIARSCRASFPAFYPQGSIDYVIESLAPEKIKSRASWTHFYVVKDEGKIIGCGAIGPYWGSETESSFFTIFVDPDYQGKGIGRKIIETLEADEYALRAKRIEIPAGMVAIPFYKKMGYEHKNGELNFDDGHFAMEKFFDR